MIDAFKNIDFVVCDVETTGLSPKFENIIEIALIKIRDGQIVDKFSSLINPEKFIPPNITLLTGIRNQDVISAPKFIDLGYKIQEFIGESIFVAHNAQFDYNFLDLEFYRNFETRLNLIKLCTCRLAKRILPNLKSARLDILTKFLDINSSRFHRAEADAYATAQILIHLLELGYSKGLFSNLNELISFQYRPIIPHNSNIKKKTINKKLNEISTSSGVYYFRNKSGEIIYIGKAKNLRTRVFSYFRSDDLKTKKIVKNAHYIDFTETGSELSALLLEAEEIKKHKPIFNKAIKTIRNYSFIKLNTENKYATLEVTRKLDSKNDLYFGPFSKYETAEKTLEIISKGTKIRECDNDTLSKKRACYLLDIERCLGPCINKDIDFKYEKELEIIRDFLSGNNTELLNRLISKMKEFAERQKFEESAKIRDFVQAILKNIGRMKVLKEPINKINALIFIYNNNNRITDVLLLKDGVLIANEIPGEDDNYLYNLVNKYFVSLKNDFFDPINLEKIKIIASFLVNKKSKYKIIYLTDCENTEQVLNKIKQTLY